VVISVGYYPLSIITRIETERAKIRG